MDYYVKGCRVISRINRSGQVMQCKIMHGVGRSGKPQEGEAGELEGSDCAGAYQAQDQRTRQSDEAAQDLCGCSGVSGPCRAVAESQAKATGREVIIRRGVDQRQEGNEILSSRSCGRLR